MGQHHFRNQPPAPTTRRTEVEEELSPTDKHPTHPHKRIRRMLNSSTCNNNRRRTEVEEELAPRAVVQDEEKLVLGLEGHVEADDEGVLDVSQDVPLRARVLHLKGLRGLG
jgi:hypothetical protein